MRFRHLLFFLALGVGLPGCGGAPDDMPEVAPVRGTVTLDGKPLALARITFSPADGGQSSDAVTDTQGAYQLSYKRDVKGAKVGTHRVMISTFEHPETTDDGRIVGGRPELVPGEYNTGGGVEKEVKAGEDNVIDFAL